MVPAGTADSMRITVAALRARAVNVPLRRPLATGGGTVAAAPLALIDLDTDAGVTGHSYVVCYTQAALKPTAELIANLGATLAGDALAPFDIERKLHGRLRLAGPQGLTGAAASGIDMAAWDALAKACGLPLARLLGGAPRPVPAYNSCGLGLIGAERAAPEARELADPGFGAIKVRLGYPDLATDLAVLKAVRGAVGDGVILMTDYNQCLSVPEAVNRVSALDGEGVAWIEEPTTAYDYDGHARIAAAARTPVQLGENWWGPHDMAKALAAGACDLAMPDAGRIGGVSGWLRAAALAEARGMPMSSHLYPEISAHLLAVTPTCHWLEYMDWAEPVLERPLRVDRGMAYASELPGSGIEWNEKAIEKLKANA